MRKVVAQFGGYGIKVADETTEESKNSIIQALDELDQIEQSIPQDSPIIEKLHHVKMIIERFFDPNKDIPIQHLRQHVTGSEKK